MGSHILPVNVQQRMIASFKKSEHLLNAIYFNEKSFREHELQKYSTDAHRARDALNAELDRFMSIPILEPISPPHVKMRKNPANWGGPLNFANAPVGTPPNSAVSRRTNNTNGRGSTRKRRRPTPSPSIPLTQVLEGV